MTVAQQTPYSPYTGNGVTTVYPYAFKILDEGDLDVYVAGVLKTLNVDYTVSGVGVDTGGSVTFAVAPGNTLSVSIIRAMVAERLTDYQFQGDFNTDTVNPDFDRAILLLQDSQTQLNRAIRTPPDEVGTIPVLPSIASRTGKYIAFDATGQPIASSGTGNDSALRTDLAITTLGADGARLLGYRFPDANAVARSVAAVLAGLPLSAADFGVTADGVTDDTVPMQLAINRAIVLHRELRLPAGTIRTTAELLVTLSGNRTNQDFTMRGQGKYATRILRGGAQTSLLRFFGAAGPSTESQVVLSDFALVGDEVGAPSILRNCNGLTLQNVAIFSLRDIRTQYCRYNLVLDGALVGAIHDCHLSDGRRGILATNSNAGVFSDVNTVTVTGCSRIDNNLEYGIDIAYASNFIASQGVNIERNGTPAGTVTISNGSPGVVTFVASNLLVDIPVVFTTTGALPTGLVAGTTYFVKTILTANTFTVSATIGGAAINTSSAGSGVHTCTPQTHGIIVRSTNDDLIGVSSVHIDGLWIESNNGGWGIFAEALGECLLTVRRCNLLQQNGIKVTSGRSVCISEMVGAANTNYDINCEFGSLRNLSINSLVDGITYPDFVNFRTATATHANGRVGTYTGTLTGCTTSPTQTVATLQRGRTVTLALGNALVGTSNTTAATITGMPAGIRPGVAKQALGVNTDNGVDKFSQISIGTDGVLTLCNAFTVVFTNIGTKGSQLFRIEYEIA